MNYQQFYKSAEPKWVSNVSGWVDRNIRQPAQRHIVQPTQKFVDKNVVQPINNRVVPPVRNTLVNTFSPVKDYANYVVKDVPKYMANEVGKGYQEYYQPYSIDHLNPLRATGLVLGGVADRYSHDYSTNQDGTPNTDKPTWGTFALDVGRNMFRNSMFDSDWRGVSQLPVMGEVENSTIANVGAIPFEVYNMASLAKPAVENIPWAKKLVKKISPFKKDVPIANMSEANKYRLYKKLEKKRAEKFREYMSPESVKKQWQALEQDPRNPISFNKYWDMVAPERKAQYIKDNIDISDKEMLLFPQLKPKYNYGRNVRGEIESIYTDSGNIPYHKAFLVSGKNLPKDPDAKNMLNFKRIYPIVQRAGFRMHRDNRWNTPEEQLNSFATDLGGDFMALTASRYLPDVAASVVSYYNPALGETLYKAAPIISRVWGDYNTLSNQYNVAKNSTGADKSSWVPDIKSWLSKKLQQAGSSIRDSVAEGIKNIPSADAVQSQGVIIPGTYNNQVQ